MTRLFHDLQIVRTAQGSNLITNDGRLVATFDPQFNAWADAMVHLRQLLHAADSLLDGALGYLSEVGDGHPYWQDRAIDDAAKLLELPELERLRKLVP